MPAPSRHVTPRGHRRAGPPACHEGHRGSSGRVRLRPLGRGPAHLAGGDLHGVVAAVERPAVENVAPLREDRVEPAGGAVPFAPGGSVRGEPRLARGMISRERQPHNGSSPPTGSRRRPVHAASRFAASAGSRRQPVYGTSRFTAPAGSRHQPVHGTSRFTAPAGSRHQPVHGTSRFTAPAGSRHQPVHTAARFTPPASSRRQPVYGIGRFTAPAGSHRQPVHGIGRFTPPSGSRRQPVHAAGRFAASGRHRFAASVAGREPSPGSRRARGRCGRGSGGLGAGTGSVAVGERSPGGVEPAGAVGPREHAEPAPPGAGRTRS
ncbi:hypothetical protein J2S44_005174 [Catenuloplanes niger]|uniref:Uncharacterized protein n=1 Tax=Catenuloplanes niger TaxID=587534 RepID=A0AAE3ZTN4_9ACTN|nr:hypothetical protein [Catenuloplanes niger]